MATERTYKTSDIARIIGVHPNTVRFYEEIGFITPPKRRENGYREFTELQLCQMRLARLAMRAEVLQNGLRKKAVEVIRLCAAPDLDAAFRASFEYKDMLRREEDAARAAASSVEALLSGRHEAESLALKRSEAAEKLGVTIDTLRNWELNGLISVKRKKSGYRVYDGDDLSRLNIIRTLRCANFSLSAILRLLTRLDKQDAAPVEEILNTPAENEDIVSVCDRLIVSLGKTREDADAMCEMLREMREKF